MVNIQLHNDCPSTDTMVPNQFIDRFMPEANGEFVKVYLYLLRCIHSHAYNCTISEIADKFNNTEMDILRALRYWQKAGLLSLEETADGKLCGISLLPFPEDTDAASAAPAVTALAGATDSAGTTVTTVNTAAGSSSSTGNPAETVPESVISGQSAPQMRKYTMDEVAEFQQNPDILELLFVVETYIKPPLSENDVNTVLFWHEELHFSVELIVYLLEYCISKGHSSMRYLNKVALGWYEKKITTVEQAKEDAAIHSQAYYGVMKALGITGRSLVESETAYIRKWTKEYAFDLPIIQEACGRTISSTHQPSFEYTDSILTSWHNSNVHTLDDIKRLDEEHSKNKKVTVKTAPSSAPRKKNSFNNFNSRDYDYKNLEEMLLSSSVH